MKATKPSASTSKRRKKASTHAAEADDANDADDAAGEDAGERERSEQVFAEVCGRDEEADAEAGSERPLELSDCTNKKPDMSSKTEMGKPRACRV